MYFVETEVNTSEAEQVEVVVTSPWGWSRPRSWNSCKRQNSCKFYITLAGGGGVVMEQPWQLHMGGFMLNLHLFPCL